MKRKIGGLDPIPPITKSEASYEKLMLQMMSKLVYETRENNTLIRDAFNLSKPNSNLSQTQPSLKKDHNRALNATEQNWSQVELSPGMRNKKEQKIQDPYEHRSTSNNKLRIMQNSQSRSKLEKRDRNITEEAQDNNQDSSMQKLFESLQARLKAGEDINRKLLQKIEKLEFDRQFRENSQSKKNISLQDIKEVESKQAELNLIEKALADKVKANQDVGKKNSYILSQILPYSDRRQIKVKFKISDILEMAQQSRVEDLKVETAEWLGQVYRATASICWNILLNGSLSFEEVKILFTENIIFNFVQFMKELKKIGKESMEGELTSIINKKSVSILDFLCRQYPQTKIEAPNLALRSILPQIDNQGRSKFDLVCKSGISFLYNESGDYTAQIMRMINFMIQKGAQDYDNFFNFIRGTFEEIFWPIFKRRKLNDSKPPQNREQPTHEDLIYKEKVKKYTKYLIGRKIPKNTSLYTEEQIDDGIFFVKSNAVLRIITKWVQELKQYFQDPGKKIKFNYNENKDHNGNVMYLSTLLKNGIHDQVENEKKALFEKIDKIRKECEKMEYLLAAEDYTTDPTQIHLSEEQISVGLYSVNIKSVISSYICSELNELIHFLLKIPRNVSEDNLGSDDQVFQAQARKELDSVNLITFKLSDLLRCKIHSNEEEIIWIVQYLLAQNQVNRKQFKIIRIKDRLGLGTRDIMINASIKKGLNCQIQLAVTSHSDKKQQLLDSYNHFLYELKRSELGSIIENVSIWSNLEQRFSYFQQLINKKKKKKVCVQNKNIKKYKFGVNTFRSFKRPLICKECNKFYPIPTTSLLNVICTQSGTTFCGQCFYYNYLDQQERKEFIFDKHRLLKPDVMSHLKEFTDFTQPFPTPGFFIKKDFLTKEMSFYMAIEKDKQQNVNDAPNTEILFVQTIIRNGTIFNRQVNKNSIYARLENKQFFIKNYEKTDLNNYIIFYFDKKEDKRKISLEKLQAELSKPEHAKTKILNILKEPTYIQNLHLLKKESQKVKQFNALKEVIEKGQIIVYFFKHLVILAQVFVKGSFLRADIRKRLNLNELKSFAEKESDIVSMEYKHMTTEMQDIATKMKPKLYSSFCQQLKKLFLSNGLIDSIKCLKNFKKLETVFINENKLTSLEGIEELEDLMAFRFDNNQVSTLQYFANNKSMRYLSANGNKLKSLKGIQNLKDLRSLSVYDNQIQSLNELRNHSSLEQLYIKGNPINDFSPIETLSNLNKLYLGRQKIKNIPNLSVLNKLKSLSIAIPSMIGNLNLQQLSLPFNQIIEIQHLNSQVELVSLNLSNNQITAIKDIDKLDKLQSLKLNNNKIKAIKGIKALDSLRYLGLKNNPIDDIGDFLIYEISFNYGITKEDLTENAKKQFADMQLSKNSMSSGQD